MRIILDLPQELERELSLDAAQLGLPLAEYALRLLATRRLVRDVPKTGADLMAYWQGKGLIGTGLTLPIAKNTPARYALPPEGGHEPEPMYLLDTPLKMNCYETSTGSRWMRCPQC
jgi:hypothetical protein